MLKMFWIHTWLPQVSWSECGEFVNLLLCIEKNVSPALYTICHQRHVRFHFYYCGYCLQWACSQCMVVIMHTDSWCDLKQVCLWWFFFFLVRKNDPTAKVGCLFSTYAIYAYCMDIAYICYIYMGLHGLDFSSISHQCSIGMRSGKGH